MQQFYGPLGLIIVSVLIVFLWFQRGLLLAGGEDGLPFYNISRSFNLFRYVWINSDTGFFNLTNLPLAPLFWVLKYFYELGISGVILQAAVFFLLISTGAFSLYFLLKETLADQLGKNRLELLSFLGALFYLLNPFSMVQIWGRGLYTQFFSFAIVPAFLYLFIRGLKKGQFFYGISAALIAAIFSATFRHPATVITVWAGAIIYLLFFIFKQRDNKKTTLFALSFFLITLVTWILFNFFWIYPLYRSGGETYSSFFNKSFGDNIASLQGVSRNAPFGAVIRLTHDGFVYNDKIYGDIYLSIPFLLISWFIPLIAILSWRRFKKFTYFGFYLPFFLASLFISLGANPPLGWLLTWLFQLIPFLQALRNPYEKFGINLLVAYIPFLMLGLDTLSEKIEHRINKKVGEFIILVGIIILCIIYVWPLWTGQFAGGIKVNPWVKVPNYYKAANDWLNGQTGEFKVLELPLNPGSGIRYTWDYPFAGIEPSEFLFDKLSISHDLRFNRGYYNGLLSSFNQEKIPNSTIDANFANGNLIDNLSKLNIKYIILHKDIDFKYNNSSSSATFENFLTNEEKIKKVSSFDKLDIYEAEIPSDITEILAEKVNLTFTKINPTLYQIKVIDAKAPYNIVFLQQFDRNWELSIDNQILSSHSQALGYANTWRVDKNGSYSLQIRFRPQDYVDLGIRVSVYAVLFAFIAAGGISLWKKRIV